MKMKKLIPNLMVEDVNRTVEFYRDVLGFELLMTDPEKGRLDWAMMKSGDIEIMFEAGKGPTNLTDMDIGGALTFFIEMDDVKELYEKLKDNDIIVQALHETVYGMQEFTIRDCNGFVLAFVEIV